MIGYHQQACQTGGFMRTFVRTRIVSIGFSVAVFAAQKPEEGGIPPSGKGDALVVRECVSGSLLKDLRESPSYPCSK